MSQEELKQMSDIELVMKRKELQDMIDELDPNLPKQLIQQYLDAVIDEMKKRVSVQKEEIILQAGLYNIEDSEFGRLYQGAVITKEGKVLNYCNSSSIGFAQHDLGIAKLHTSIVTDRFESEVDTINKNLGNSNWKIEWSSDDWLPSHIIEDVKSKVANYQQRVRDEIKDRLKEQFEQ